MRTSSKRSRPSHPTNASTEFRQGDSLFIVDPGAVRVFGTNGDEALVSLTDLDALLLKLITDDDPASESLGDGATQGEEGEK
jgi:hypothetical protein